MKSRNLEYLNNLLAKLIKYSNVTSFFRFVNKSCDIFTLKSLIGTCKVHTFKPLSHQSVFVLLEIPESKYFMEVIMCSAPVSNSNLTVQISYLTPF